MAPKPSQKPAAPAGSLIISEPSLSAQIGQIGGGITPRMVSGILALADLGQTYKLVDLGHDSRQKDGTIHAALSLAEQAVSQLKYKVKPPPKASAKEKKICEAFTDFFDNAEKRYDFIAHTIGETRLFGHSTTEVVWGYDEKYVGPRLFKPIHCRRFGFREYDGALVFTNQAGTNPALGIELLKEYADGNFVQVRQRVNGDAPAREGLVRLIVWLAQGRNWTYRDMMQMAELAWKPKRLGKYKKNADKDDIAILKRILLDIMTSGAAVHSEDVEIELLWPQGAAASGGASKSVHQALLQWIGGEVCKAIIGSADQLEPGENGARAAVETRSQNPKMIRDANAINAAEYITRQLLAPFTKYNGGDRVRPGTFEFITDDPADLEKLSKAVLNFKNASARIGENWFYEATNITPPTDGERVIGEDDQANDNGKTDGGKPVDANQDKPEDDANA
jgi:phage gp29-like protein